MLWLIAGAIFFTLRMQFINIRAFKHAIDIVRGKYDDPEEAGEVMHFQALATALSASVGLGNIAGVAIAVSVGGPGGCVWMTVGGRFGMTSKFYVAASLLISLTNIVQIPAAIGTIVSGAFNPQAIEGGFLGVMVQGLRRSAFSKEAGIGSAAIAHAAARTEEPIRKGSVALLEPFIDTIAICNMTALALVITGAYQKGRV